MENADDASTALQEEQQNNDADAATGIIVRLQPLIRGSIARRRLASSIKTELESHVVGSTTTSGATNTGGANCRCNNVRLLRIGQALYNSRLQSLLFVVVVDSDGHENLNKYTLMYCDLLARSMRSASLSESFASLFLSTNFMGQACTLVTKLAGKIMRLIDGADISKISESRKIASLVSALHIFCSCSQEAWPILRGKNEGVVVPILDGLCSKILLPVATQENAIPILMKTISSGLKGSRQPMNECVIDQLVFILLRFLQIISDNTGNSPAEDNASCQTFIDLLTIPTISLMLTQNSISYIEKHNFLENSIKWWVQQQQNAAASTGSTSKSPVSAAAALSTNKALNLLGNIIHLGNKDKNTLKRCLLDWACMVNQLLERCSAMVTSGGDNKKRSNCWHHPLLGWTAERIDDGLQWTFPRLRAQISALWSQQMVQFLSDNFFFSSATAAAEEIAMKEPIAGAGDEMKKLSRKSSSPSYSPPMVSMAVDNNTNKMPAEFLQKFIGKIAARTSSARRKHQDRFGGGNIQPVPLPPITLPVILCQLYQNALFAFQNSRIDILSSLSRDDSLILAKLWHFIRFTTTTSTERDKDNNNNGGGGAAAGIRAYLGYLVTDPDVAAPQFAPLHLFGDIAYSLISILDEQEMYETERPFNRDQLGQIARFANRFCYHAIADALIDFDQPKPAALFTSMYQLLSILYSRDCRRPFTPVAADPSFWTIPEINAKSFVAEFERSSDPAQRAHILMDKMPHIISLKDRIFLFRRFISQDRDASTLPLTIITVERSRLIEDGYRQLGGLSGQALRGTVRVKFINQQGLDEAGIDQDGVFKEFLELTLKRVFTPELNLFKCSHDKLLYPASTSAIQENHLELFSFVGRMLGKAVYEGICVDIQLAPVLLAAVLGKQLCPFDELASLDPLLYKNLTYVKHYTEDVEELALTFSFSEEFLGKIYTYELITGGRDLKVNNENKISYLHLMAHYRVVKQIREQTRAFVAGFRSIIRDKWLSLFSTHELQFLISGQLSDVDLDDLKKHVQYYGGFHSNHRLIRWLWSILDEEFSAEERRLFLKFVTSCSRPPLLGFAYLEPSFSIRCIETSDDLDQGDTLGSVIRGFLAINKRKLPVNERLPTASTCFNLLKLPNYTKRSILLAKLRYAIHSETGFELS